MSQYIIPRVDILGDGHVPFISVGNEFICSEAGDGVLIGWSGDEASLGDFEEAEIGGSDFFAGAVAGREIVEYRSAVGGGPGRPLDCDGVPRGHLGGGRPRTAFGVADYVGGCEF